MDIDGIYLITARGKYFGVQDDMNCFIHPLSIPIINYKIAEFVPRPV